jgi:hypothetical protein
MKRRWLAALVGGFALGLVVGLALGLLTRPGSSQRAGPAATPDQVIAHVDFKAAVAWAGQGKWTVESFPVDGLNATEYKPPSPSTSQGDLSSKSLRYLARCGQPLTVDEQQTFFNRFVNHLSDAIGKHAYAGAGGGVGPLPHNRLRVYCYHSDFHTGENPPLGTVGGLRGTATVLMVSDGESATLFLTLTEVTPNAG